MYAFNLLTAVFTFFLICTGFILIINKKVIKYKKTTPSYTILFVTNNEDCIEGVLRRLICKINADRNYNEKIIIISINSTDQTLHIIKKLSRKYPFIYLPYNAEQV